MPRTAPRIAVALALTSLALLPAGFAAAAAQPTAPTTVLATDTVVTWSVEPTQTAEGLRRNFDYIVDPGTQIVDSVIVTNQSPIAAEFQIYATDAINEFETGAFSLLKGDETPIDSGAWITTASDKITIEPGMQATIPFTLLVPSDATPGDHVAGIVASVLTTGETDGAAVVLEQRVGARVYLNVTGPAESGVELSGVTSGFTPEINPFAPGAVSVSYDVRNTGNVRLDVRQKLEIAGPFGIPLGTISPDPLTELLPRQTVRVTENVPAITALLLAWSTVTAVPGEIGSGTEPLPSTEVQSGPATPAPLASETPGAEEGTAAEEGAAAEGDAATEEPAAEPTSEAVTDTTVVEDGALEFEPVSSTVTSLAVSWTMLALIVLVLALVYLGWRYVSGTRERMYLAIDEAAEAARVEALAAPAEKQAP